MSEFTKGPWKVGMGNGHNANIICAGEDNSICSIYGIPLHTHVTDALDKRWQEGMANAHLIAAAPEMFEALKSIQEIFSLYGPGMHKGPTERMIAAAIAKAEGKVRP